MTAHRYIGIDSRGNRVERTDLMFLDALSLCDKPVTTDALVELADPRNLAKLNNSEAIRQLTFMLADGWVERGELRLNGLDARGWVITNKGRAHLVAQEARNIFDECARWTPVARERRAEEKPPIEEAPEPIRRTEAGAALHEGLKASVSMCDAKEVPTAPPTALLRVDEDELDDWWETLDVEMKADAFARFALHMYDGHESHVYVEETSVRIPLLGSVGDLSEEMKSRLSGELSQQSGGAL